MIYELNVYKPHNGKAPFEKWLTSLKDTKTKQIIQARIDRAVFGNLGDIKGLGATKDTPISDAGWHEEKGLQNLLLVGGDKRTQSKDIEKAKLYLNDWKNDE